MAPDQDAEDVADEIGDLCFVLIEDNGSFCGWTLPCPEHSDGGDHDRT